MFEEKNVPELDDGLYLARMDECDDAEEVEIKEGKAYKNGKHFIFIGYEWKKL